MENQMTLLFSGLLALSSVNGFAGADQTRTLTCLIDKSDSLVISFSVMDGETRHVELHTQNFLGENAEHVITLSKPKVIQYGNVLMVSQDFGKSGYVFLRFEQKSSTESDGLIDINYFQRGPFTTEGKLVSIPCFSYGS